MSKWESGTYSGFASSGSVRGDAVRKRIEEILAADLAGIPRRSLSELAQQLDDDSRRSKLPAYQAMV